MAHNDVHQAAKDVTDAQSFITFLDILRADWDTACATDLKIGQPQGSKPDDNPWTQAAQILLLGKLYE